MPLWNVCLVVKNNEIVQRNVIFRYTIFALWFFCEFIFIICIFMFSLI